MFGVDSFVLTSPVAELKMQRSRILAAGDCEEDRLVHSTTLVAEIRAQVVETSPFSGAQNKFEKNMRWLKYDLQRLGFNCEVDVMQSCHFASLRDIKQIVLTKIQHHVLVPN